MSCLFVLVSALLLLYLLFSQLLKSK